MKNLILSYILDSVIYEFGTQTSAKEGNIIRQLLEFILMPSVLATCVILR